MAITRQAISWNAQTTPPELHSMLRVLGEHYPITEGAKRGAIRVKFQPGASKGSVEVALHSREAEVKYDQPLHAARGLGAVLAGLVQPERPYSDFIPFETFGIMLDCSRNAVMTVEHVKCWLRQLCLLGYNMAMLYTEDTYKLPGEEYFGYLRGAYSQRELKEIDDYAASIGMQMIGCIQTLGHLEQILHWPAYDKVRDTGAVMMVDEEQTYQLIEKMLANFAQCYRSRRIHIGMDETHDLGRGRFLDQKGYERPFDIFNRHLKRVIELCKKHGLSPMIWSDMYFRMGSKTQAYYDADCLVPDDVKAAMPHEAQLVYWDYYHKTKQEYADMIDRHRALGFEPIMGSGVWTWRCLWYQRYETESSAGPCVAACREKGLKEVFFTMWGDDGAACEFDSAMAGLAHTAEIAYRGEGFAQDDLDKRFAAVCGSDYSLVRDASALNLPHLDVLWDDPILGIVWKDLLTKDADVWNKAVIDYQALLARLAPVRKQTQPIDFAHAIAMVEFMLAKTQLKLDLEKAYAARDMAGLQAVRMQIPQVIRRLDALHVSFRRQWYRRNKPHGFETLQLRLGGMRLRYQELAQRLAELQAGRISNIPEMDEKIAKGGFIWPARNVMNGSVIV